MGTSLGLSKPPNFQAMTELLERALSEISKLPENEQDALASVILQEMAAEKKWSKMFEQSQDLLADMAQEAEEE